LSFLDMLMCAPFVALLLTLALIGWYLLTDID